MLKHIKIHRLLLIIAGSALLLLAPTVAMAQVASAHVVVNTYRLNVRSGPGAGHDIITTVAGGTELPVTMLSRDRKWYQVTSSVGPGWLHSAYAVARGDFSGVPRQGAPATSAGTSIAPGAPHVVVNTAYLNVRNGPGVGNSILTIVRGGTALAVTAVQFGGAWYQVETAAGAGWVRSSYTVKRGDFTGITTAGEPGESVPQPSIPAGSPYLVVNTAYLNVRSGPGVGHNIVTTVRGGTNLPITAIDSGRVWYQVNTSAGSGWVNSTYTVVRGNTSSLSRVESGAREGAHLGGPTPRAVVNTYRLNIRTGPGAGHAIITSVPGGTTLAVLGKSRGLNWYLVEGSFGRGWLNRHYTVFRGDFSQVQFAN